MKILFLIIILIIGAILLLFLSIFLGLMLYTGVYFVIHFLLYKWQGKGELDFDEILGEPSQKKHIIGGTVSILFVALGLILGEGVYKFSFLEALYTFGFFMFFLLLTGSYTINKLKEKRRKPPFTCERRDIEVRKNDYYFNGIVILRANGRIKSKYQLVSNGSVIKVKNKLHLRMALAESDESPESFKIVAPLREIKLLSGSIPENQIVSMSQSEYYKIKSQYDEMNYLKIVDYISFLTIGGPDEWNELRDEHPALIPDLSNIDLNNCCLEYVNFSNCNLLSANLSEANLQMCDFQDANLFRANLHKSDLSEATFVGTNLEEADLSETDLSDSDLSECKLQRADLTNSNLSDCNLFMANLTDADLTNVDLSGAKNLTIEQLISVLTLYGATIDQSLFSVIQKVYPSLLQKSPDAL